MGKKIKPAPGSVAVQRTGWTDTASICRKCSKKLQGGFGADGSLPFRRALREALKANGQRGEIGLLEVGCLGVCPKGAVTVVLASAPGEILIVGKGAPAGCILDRQPAREGWSE